MRGYAGSSASRASSDANGSPSAASAARSASRGSLPGPDVRLVGKHRHERNLVTHGTKRGLLAPYWVSVDGRSEPTVSTLGTRRTEEEVP